jgi:hypothetical protein
MTPSTGSRWNPRRPLAVLATLSASVLIGSMVSQYAATAGFAGPQLPTQDGISVSLVSDPIPIGNCARRLTDPPRAVKTQHLGLETSPLLLRSADSPAPAPAASPLRTNAPAPAPATSAHRLNEASGCTGGIFNFSQHQQGPPVCPTPAHGLETSPLLLRSANSPGPAPAASPPGLVEASRSAPTSRAGATAHCAAGISSFTQHQQGPSVSAQPTSRCIDPKVSRGGLINPTVPVC